VVSENAPFAGRLANILNVSKRLFETGLRAKPDSRPLARRDCFVLRALRLLTAVTVAAVLLSSISCNDYNPYLGASPTVSSNISSITPSGTTAGHQDILMTVNGAGFAAGSTVTWNSSGSTSTNLVSNVLSSTQVQANIPASLLTTPGTFFVGVIAPGPTSGNNAGNNISNFVPFLVCGNSGCPSAAPTFSAKFANSSRAASVASINQAPAPRYEPVIADSADGSLDTGSAVAKIFLHDSCAGAVASCIPQIIPISVGFNGAGPNGPSTSPSVTNDGRFVVFASEATNLVKGDSNGWTDIFLRDTCIGAGSACVPNTTRISLGPDGAQANGPSYFPAISFDGRFVAFNSAATNLVRLDSLNSLPATSNPPLFLRDTCFGAPPGCVPATSRVVPAPAPQH
jgi:hypothetical protein